MSSHNDDGASAQGVAPATLAKILDAKAAEVSGASVWLKFPHERLAAGIFRLPDDPSGSANTSPSVSAVVTQTLAANPHSSLRLRFPNGSELVVDGPAPPITEGEMAKRANVDPKTFKHWVNRYNVRSIETAGGQRRYFVHETLEDLKRGASWGDTEISDGKPAPRTGITNSYAKANGTSVQRHSGSQSPNTRRRSGLKKTGRSSSQSAPPGFLSDPITNRKN